MEIERSKVPDTFFGQSPPEANLRFRDPLGAIQDLVALADETPVSEGVAAPAPWIFPATKTTRWDKRSTREGKWVGDNWGKQREERAMLLDRCGALRAAIGDSEAVYDRAYAELVRGKNEDFGRQDYGDAKARRAARLSATADIKQNGRPFEKPLPANYGGQLRRGELRRLDGGYDAMALRDLEEALALAPADKQLQSQLRDVQKLAASRNRQPALSSKTPDDKASDDAKFETHLAAIEAGKASPRALLDEVNADRQKRKQYLHVIPAAASDKELAFLVAEALWIRSRATSDPKRQIQWAEQSVALGFAEAAERLGSLYWKKRDLKNAKHYFTIALNEWKAGRPNSIDFSSRDLAEGHLDWIARVERLQGLPAAPAAETKPLPKLNSSPFADVWSISHGGSEKASGYCFHYDYSAWRDNTDFEVGDHQSIARWEPLADGGVQLTIPMYGANGATFVEMYVGRLVDKNTLQGEKEITRNPPAEGKPTGTVFKWTGRRYMARTTIPDDPQAWTDAGGLSGTLWKLISAPGGISSGISRKYQTFSPDHRVIEHNIEVQASPFGANDAEKKAFEKLRNKVLETSRWISPDAKAVRFQLDEGAVIYDGSIVGPDTIHGTAVNNQGASWKWMAERLTELPPRAPIAPKVIYTSQLRSAVKAVDRGEPKDLPKALEVIDATLGKTKAPFIYTLRCRIHLLLGNGKEALADADELLRMNPENAQAVKFRYFALTILEDRPEAEKISTHYLFRDVVSGWDEELAKLRETTAKQDASRR